MRFFTCVVDPQGRGISDDARRAYEAFPRRRGLEYRWRCLDHVAVLTGWDDPYGDPLLARAEDADWTAAGVVRLDNRPELARWAECDDAGVTDLELVRCVIARHGARSVARFLGDFAFVAWNGRTRTAVAACDTFAVQKLYYVERNGLVVFASRAEALALEDGYEVQYLTETVSLHDTSRGLTVYAGVRAVPRASMALLDGGRLTIHTYWHPADFAMASSWTNTENETIETCRELLVAAVRRRVVGNVTWAQLSGGLDSSSVASLVQWLHERGEIANGLAGTVTFVDHHGTGTDERAYVRAVVDRWGVRNEPIIDPPLWYDERYALPHTDQPIGDLHVYPRDRRLCTLVRSAGGRVLLTGTGGDQLFMGNMLFFADWLKQGRVRHAVHEMARRAAIGRVSFWELAYRNAVLPLLPRVVRRRLVHDRREARALPWLQHATMQRYGPPIRFSATSAQYDGPPGKKYHHVVTSTIEQLEPCSHGGVIEESLDVRHPLLYRPLVEFALRLPPELRARPHAHRWVIREAMRGILPEEVRTRVGKSGTADVLAWSFRAHQAHLAPLVREPILGDLGVLDPFRLRSAFDAVLARARGAEAMYGPLIRTLAVEQWLQIRSGRWPRRGHVSEN